MSKLEIVSMIRIDGEHVLQEDIPTEEFRAMLAKKLDEGMASIRFRRKIKTAA